MTPEALLPEALLDRYRPERLLGEGGFGRVVLAQDLELGRAVAIKLLAGALQDDAARGRFQREARVTAQLVHPGVVRVFDHGVTAAGFAYIVYEAIAGSDLGTLAPRGPEPGRVLGWARQLARALHAVHQEGVVHRDVKPENVLVRTADDTAVLCDFGLARSVEGHTMLTAEGVLMGTPRYMAPELWRGEPPTFASDQFAWAATILAALGEPGSYAADDWREILAELDGYRPPALAGLASCAPSLAACLRRALAARPDERFATMEAAALALDGVPPGADRATLALRPPTTVAPHGEITRPRPGPRGVGRRGPLVVGATLAVLAGAWWLGGPQGEGRSPGTAEAARCDSRDEAWERVEAARDDLERFLGLAQGWQAWVDVAGPRHAHEIEDRLRDERIAVKVRRLLDSLLHWEEQERRRDGFRAVVAGAHGRIEDPAGVRLRGMGTFLRVVLASFGHASDSAMENFGQAGVLDRMAVLQKRRDETREAVAERLEMTPPDPGPAGLPLACMRMRLASDVGSPSADRWLRSLPGLVEPGAPTGQLSEVLSLLVGHFESVQLRGPDQCQLVETLSGWRFEIMMRWRSRPDGRFACASLGGQRWGELRHMIQCPDPGGAPLRYARLLEETAVCAPQVGGDPQLLNEVSLLEELRGSARGSLVDVRAWQARVRSIHEAARREPWPPADGS